MTNIEHFFLYPCHWFCISAVVIWDLDWMNSMIKKKTSTNTSLIIVHRITQRPSTNILLVQSLYNSKPRFFAPNCQIQGEVVSYYMDAISIHHYLVFPWSLQWFGWRLNQSLFIPAPTVKEQCYHDTNKHGHILYPEPSEGSGLHKTVRDMRIGLDSSRQMRTNLCTRTFSIMKYLPARMTRFQNF